MKDNKTVPARIGSMQFLVDSTIDTGSSGTHENSSGVRQTSPNLSLISSTARDNLIEVVDQLRVEFHKRWEDFVVPVPGPAEMSIEVSFAFESGINAWVIAGKGTAGVKVLFKWARSDQ